ncbi:transposase [Paraburkholderia sp. J67]|uniref:transposase n=1 Tax=Paraburkholderia sp. J67 TaxID=2805435 RepID=UPI0039F4DA81
MAHDPKHQCRWAAERKLTLVSERFKPPESVLMVARQHGANPSQIFRWRNPYQGGPLSAVKVSNPESLPSLAKTPSGLEAPD